MGAAGERLAAWCLRSHGLVVVAGNVEVHGGEIDLLALDGGKRVAVEVRTVTGDYDPLDAVGDTKRDRVVSLAAKVGAQRVDFVGIRLRSGGFDFHWLPGST